LAGWRRSFCQGGDNGRSVTHGQVWMAVNPPRSLFRLSVTIGYIDMRQTARGRAWRKEDGCACEWTPKIYPEPPGTQQMKGMERTSEIAGRLIRRDKEQESARVESGLRLKKISGGQSRFMLDPLPPRSASCLFLHKFDMSPPPRTIFRPHRRSAPLGVAVMTTIPG